MPTIAIDARELRTSTGRYVERLLHYLQQIDNEHDYLVLLKPQDMAGWQPSNPRFSTVACPHKEFSFDEQIGFKKQLDGLQPDLVHFSMVQQPVWYRGNVVTTMQDLTTVRFRNPAKNSIIFTLRQQVYKWVNKRVAKKSTALITPTQFVKDDVVAYTGVSPDRITVTLESADHIDDQPVPVEGLVSKQFLVYVGRPTPHKNLERLIDAFVSLKAHHPGLVLALVGKKDANYERIAADVKARALKDIYFTDFVSDAQLRWLYEHCAAYVFPSLSEGFGLPPLEAMVHGATVVASTATCIPEVLGNAAHYFDPYDVPAMADAIDEVLTDKLLRQKLIKAGQQQVKKYSWKRMAEQTLAVYKRVLDET